MAGRCSRVFRYLRIGGGRRVGGGGDRCPRFSRGLGLVVEGIFVVMEIGALEVLGILGLAAEGIFVVGWVGVLGALGGLGLGCKEGLRGLSAF